MYSVNRRYKMIKYIPGNNSKLDFGKKTLRAFINGSVGLIALCSVGLMTSTTEVSAVDLEGCVLLPNTGNYVRYPGQIDCYTGQHVSVEGNAGNNIGVAPGKRAPRSEYDRLCRNIDRQVGISISEAKQAKAAFRARDWSAFKQHTKASIAAAKKAKKKIVRKIHLKH